MDDWALHWLEASGDLSGYRGEITAAFEQAYRTVSALLPPPRLDVLIQLLSGATIPGVGIAGFAHRSTMFSMTFDPCDPGFAQSLKDGALPRHIVHEVHHCLRMAGPGYGHTLGEALVTEGLAGQFVRHLLRTPPEPWECAVAPEILEANLPSIEELAAPDYDHAAWFFGTASQPCRFGYTLGYQIAGRWLERAGGADAETWVNVPAATVLAMGLAPDERTWRQAAGRFSGGDAVDDQCGQICGGRLFIGPAADQFACDGFGSAGKPYAA